MPTGPHDEPPPDPDRDTGELPVASGGEPDPSSPDQPAPQRSVDELAAFLRAEPTVAPQRVTERAVARVRVESTALALARTLGGAWLRVARALPDLLAPPDPVPPPAPPLRADTREPGGTDEFHEPGA